MATKTTMITVEGDREYVRTVGMVALSKNTTVGKLTRDALDAMYGADIARATEFFVGDSETQNSQSRQSRTRKSKAN